MDYRMQRNGMLSENEDVKLLWDFSIQTDKVIHARRPDIVIMKKKDKECMIIDVAVPALSDLEKGRGEDR